MKGINDINRIKDIFLEGTSQFFRQTICIGSFYEWNLLKSLSKNSSNMSGYSIIKNKYNGEFQKFMIPQCKTLFKRIDAPTLKGSILARFNSFTTQLWPHIKPTLTTYSVIVASSFYDFIRLKKYFK